MAAAIAGIVPGTILRESSIKDEYYFGDLPGTLQLRKDPHELAKLDLSHLSDETKGWIIAPKSIERFLRLLRRNKKIDGHELLCVVQSIGTDGHVWLKGAILNKSSGLVYLMTATNNRAMVSRPLDSHDHSFVIGHYRMCAPKIFWSHLKETLVSLGYGSS